MDPFDDMDFQETPRSGVYCVGSGMTAAYIRNGDIIQLFGPCYSMPSVLSMKLAGEDLICVSRRRRKAVIWRTDITDRGGNKIGSMIDFCHPERPVFIRRFSLSTGIVFSLDSEFETFANPFVGENGAAGPERPDLIFRIPQGSRVFGENYTDKEIFARLLLPVGSELGAGRVVIPAGDSELIFVAGEYVSPARPSFVSCMDEGDVLARADIGAVYDECLEYWWKRFGEIMRLPESVCEMAEDTAAALMSQTSIQGGVLAGSAYHLAYGRDMYGVIRGYLALGMYGQAKRCADFFVREFRTKGSVPNAGGMGMSCSHCHENDDCEQTGYYLLELTDIISACGDSGFAADRSDYVRYLLEAQEKRLCRGMLPFNGDETYIAGGLLSRGCIDHGSMEATALYITGAERILDAAERYGFLDGGYIAARRAAAEKAAKLFRENFLSDDGGTLYCNAPSRLEDARMPGYRHGVCVGCGRMEYLAMTKTKSYLCARCFGADISPDAGRYSLDSASLMLGFAGSGAVSRDLIVSAAKKAYEGGRGGKKVGYESGIQLYILCGGDEEDHALLGAIADEVERLRGLEDGTGVWVEYYEDGKVGRCCTYRPWESAINMCGLIRYAEMTEKRKTE